jgi:hypothetical protein
MKISNWSTAQIKFQAGIAGQRVLNEQFGLMDLDRPKSRFASIKNSNKIHQSHCQQERVCQIFDKKSIR